MSGSCLSIENFYNQVFWLIFVSTTWEQFSSWFLGAFLSCSNKKYYYNTKDAMNRIHWFSHLSYTVVDNIQKVYCRGAVELLNLSITLYFDKLKIFINTWFFRGLLNQIYNAKSFAPFHPWNTIYNQEKSLGSSFYLWMMEALHVMLFYFSCWGVSSTYGTYYWAWLSCLCLSFF